MVQRCLDKEVINLPLTLTLCWINAWPNTSHYNQSHTGYVFRRNEASAHAHCTALLKQIHRKQKCEALKQGFHIRLDALMEMRWPSRSETHSRNTDFNLLNASTNHCEHLCWHVFSIWLWIYKKYYHLCIQGLFYINVNVKLLFIT